MEGRRTLLGRDRGGFLRVVIPRTVGTGSGSRRKKAFKAEGGKHANAQAWMSVWYTEVPQVSLGLRRMEAGVEE